LCTQARAASGVTKVKPSAPMPHSPALPIVWMFEQATQSGGCGFWNGLGMTLRAGKS
jgi:formate-dependent nitrite reductase membrane component NrfD